MKKTVIILALVFLIVFQAAGNGTKESQNGAGDKPVVMRWTNWGQSFDALKPAFDAMEAGFLEKHPEAEIEQIGYPYNQFKDQLLVMATAGNAPDISMIKAEWVSAFVEADVLQPLNDILDQSVIDDFYPGLLAGATYDGKIMSVPWAPSPIAVYYNKTLLKKAGYDNPPKTWKEMMEQAEAISKLGTDESKIYGIGFAGKKLPGAGYFFLINMWQNGGEFINDHGEIAINSPGNLAALAEIKKAVENGVCPAGLELNDLRDLFAHEQIGFHFDLEAAGGIFQGLNPKGADYADEYGIIVVPGQNGPQGKTIAIEHHLVMFNDSDNKELAGDLLDFLTGPEGISIYNANNGFKLPARNSVSELAYYDDPDSAFLNIFIDALGTAEGLPAQNVMFLTACEDIAEAIQRVSLNDEEPAAVLSELDAQIKALYKQ